MTVATVQETYEKPDYYCIDDDDDNFFSVEAIAARRGGYSSPAGETERSTFADRWQFTDTVAQLVDELSATGRDREAAAVQRVLGHDDDETAMRAYVSRLWADDWNSPEDAVYDE